MTPGFLLELHRVLESKGKLSKWEKELFKSIAFSAVTDFFKGAVGSISVVWPAFWAIPTISRLTLSTVAGIVAGNWYGCRTIGASIDRSLGLQGTRVQRELASLILTEYKDDKSLQMLMRKHFYSEQVFRDVNSEVPVFLWRPRNTYVEFSLSQNQIEADGVELNQKNRQHEPTTEKSDTTPHSQKSDYSENSSLHEKQNTTRNHNWDLFVDPLESIFGYPEGSMEAKPMRQSEATEVLSRREVRALKRRAHRRQRSSDTGLS
ncbi:hypothetical protein LUZ63_018746 [Rhynchospora breviuscula]|uniref:Uncharacterized protein n=1 Tax=Rhynchospora breviuscula TaxID=2022672 RepID=A0A9Q0HI38_9POAL|nr:hypothetical protein LUZ63_018746 [Rhynchospora breviuscula]